MDDVLNQAIEAAASLYEGAESEMPERYHDTEYSRGMAETIARMFPLEGFTDESAAVIWTRIQKRVQKNARRDGRTDPLTGSE